LTYAASVAVAAVVRPFMSPRIRVQGRQGKAVKVLTTTGSIASTWRRG
jgi:hypothetical protein